MYISIDSNVEDTWYHHLCHRRGFGCLVDDAGVAVVSINAPHSAARVVDSVAADADMLVRVLLSSFVPS